MKQLEWIGSSYKDLCSFPEEASRAASFKISLKDSL